VLADFTLANTGADKSIYKPANTPTGTGLHAVSGQVYGCMVALASNLDPSRPRQCTLPPTRTFQGWTQRGSAFFCTRPNTCDAALASDSASRLRSWYPRVLPLSWPEVPRGSSSSRHRSPGDPVMAFGHRAYIYSLPARLLAK